MQVQGYSELVAICGGAHPLHRQAVAQQEVVGGRKGVSASFASRRMDAEAVAHPGRDPGFVQGDPEPTLVAERLVDDPDILGEALARLPAGPAAAVFER